VLALASTPRPLPFHLYFPAGQAEQLHRKGNQAIDLQTQPAPTSNLDARNQQHVWLVPNLTCVKRLYILCGLPPTVHVTKISQ
jgi:hypothetical protein